MGNEAEDTEQVEPLTAALVQDGVFDVIERLSTSPDALGAAGLYLMLARHFYRQDLAIAVVLWQAAIQHCLTESARGSEREALRQKAMACSFNLGANTWPGWGEHAISDVHLAIGREAARLNLRLAQELAKGPLAESKSHWLIGAHRLAISDFAGARQSFERAKGLAQEAADAETVAMNDGYLALTSVLGDESGAPEQLAAVLAELRGNTAFKYGAFFAEQLETALRALGAGRTI